MNEGPEKDALATPEEAAWANGAIAAVRGEVHKVIVGQDRVLDETLLALLCGGHAVVEGVPGLAKTLLIATLARTLSMQFSRIQFTPDLMPSDITGTEVIEEDRASGTRALRFVRGPIFANLVLADEINRTPPKTQAALLEAMQERQVTVGGVAHRLPSPFFVLATQNPIEQEGTYPLPEAQLDRFMLNIRIGYPTEAEELEIVTRTTGQTTVHTDAVMDAAELARAQAVVRRMPVAEHVARYALRLVRATRVGERGSGMAVDAPKVVRDYVAWGAGPRASQFLILAAKARALMTGATHVQPEHLQSVALPVLRHRIVTNFNAEADGVTSETVVQRLLEATPVDAAADARPLDRLIS
jgi:MoxR-like ATPase